MAKKRLAKYLSAAGIASRRKCEEMIFAGRVKVNGKTTLLPQTLVDGSETIRVDDQNVKAEEEKIYLLLNKPAGYLCSPAKGRKSKMVLDLFSGFNQRLFTIGRLDKDSTGLLLITNDGVFAHQVIHPSSNIKKEYIVKADQEISAEHLKTISAGVWIEGGFVKPLRVRKIRKGTLKVVVGEGKKREVRCLVEAAGLNVRELKRVRIGGLLLGDLPIGSWRPLTEKDKKSIFE